MYLFTRILPYIIYGNKLLTMQIYHGFEHEVTYLTSLADKKAWIPILMIVNTFDIIQFYKQCECYWLNYLTNSKLDSIVCNSCNL